MSNYNFTTPSSNNPPIAVGKDTRRGTISKKFGQLSQSIGEKLSVTSKTEFSVEFKEQVQTLENIQRIVTDLLKSTQTYVNGGSGRERKGKRTLPPVADMGSELILYGLELGDDSELGYILVKTGEVEQRMGSIRLTLEENIKGKFVNHFKRYSEDDLEATQNSLKKLENRRLDFDALEHKRKSRKFSASESLEYDLAKAKFEESYVQTASRLTTAIKSREDDHFQALTELIQTQIQYHRHCLEELDLLVSIMASGHTYKGTGESRPTKDQIQRYMDSGLEDEWAASITEKSKSKTSLLDPFAYKPLEEASTSSLQQQQQQQQSDLINLNDIANQNVRNDAALEDVIQPDQRLVVALFDFDGSQPGDLSFKKDDLIVVDGKVNEDWLTGQTEGRSGMFPTNFVRDLDLDAPGSTSASHSTEIDSTSGKTRLAPAVKMTPDDLAGLYSKQVYDPRLPAYEGNSGKSEDQNNLVAPPCPTCFCDEFNRNPFKHGMVCRNCFHDHMPGQFFPDPPTSSPQQRS